jgi:hypothetical protein
MLPPVMLISPCDSNASGWPVPDVKGLKLPVAVNVPPLMLIWLKAKTAIPLDVTPVNSTLLLESSN